VFLKTPLSVPPREGCDGSPIHLAEFLIDGFVVGVNEGTVAVQPRGAYTSDQPEFHRYIDGVTSGLSHVLEATGHEVFFDKVSWFLVVVHGDRSAELYVDTVPVSLLVRVKRDCQIGEAVTDQSMADVKTMRFDGLELADSDQIIFCFKVGWKFALFFDLGRRRDGLDQGYPLNVPAMEADLAHLYRLLRFQAAYEAVANKGMLDRLLADGWFPFIEILGPDFERLHRGYRDGAIEAHEDALLKTFTAERIDGLAAGWWRHAVLADRRPILEPAIEAFKRGEAVSTIKILLTEIEGVIRDAYVAALGETAKLGKLLDFLIERGVTNSSPASTYFPLEFLAYLQRYTFANFDLGTGAGVATARHGASHGVMKAEDYTLRRALQAILTVDQMRFYL
jgi:hypothetical protein